jgi:hypothetical protein
MPDLTIHPDGALEGSIRVTLTRRGTAVGRVGIDSSRPQLAQRLMAGRAPDQVVRLAGQIFSLCGQAQALAARLACAAAGGDAGAADPLADGGVLLELAREHAWRLLIDWPSQAGEAAEPQALLLLGRAGRQASALATSLEDILAERLLGEPAPVWLARDAAGLADWIGRGATLAARLFAGLGTGPDLGATACPLLPTLAELGTEGVAALARRAMDQPDFCATPDWRGLPAETGAIARCQHEPWIADWQLRRGRGAGARMLARLLELARLPEHLRRGGGPPALAATLDDGLGAAVVETSRGLLLHAVQLKDERVVQYRTLAPTEWNFHPAGPLAQALADLPADGALKARARFVAQALDPCVGYALEVIDA